MNIFSPHIAFAEMADLAEVNGAPPARMQEHLSACAQCSKELNELRRTIGLMRSDSAEDAPPELVASAKRIFRGPTVRRVLSPLARIVASLDFDSLTDKPAFGLRSSISTGRQLLYSTEIADIDLRVSAQSGEWELAGQVLCPSQSEGQVSLESDTLSAASELNELSEFIFKEVPSGTYKLLVRLTEVEIEIPPLQLGE